MKILFITHHVKGNDGWSRYARDFIGAVKKEGAEVLCLVNEISFETDIPQKKCLDMPLRYVANPFISLKTAYTVNTIIREFSPDIIQFIVEPYGTMIPFLKKGSAKIVLNAHSTFAFLPILVSSVRRIVSNYMTRLTYAKTDSVICISEYTKRHLLHHMATLKALPLVEKKITIVSGGIDLSGVTVQKERHVPSNAEILFVGAIKPRKGLKEAIDALALVKTDYMFRIVGMYHKENPYFLLLKRKIEEYGLERKIIFTGQISDEELQKLYDKADLFLMLSTNNGADFEGYGLVYLEANAHGVPCIGPNDSGVSDAIVDGKTGYLVNQYDPAAVARTIEHIIRDRPIQASDCRAWAHENSIEKKGRIMLSLYKAIMAKPS